MLCFHRLNGGATPPCLWGTFPEMRAHFVSRCPVALVLAVVLAFPGILLVTVTCDH